ncbi:MAG: S8 family serine peptidase [Verrucomicrobiota bacterium]
MRQRWFRILVLCAGYVLLFGSPPTIFAADKPSNASALLWQSASNRVDAHISAWPLDKVLGRIARATGWEIFVEPGMERPINATFTGLSPQQALTRLLGGLSFSLQPRPGAPARLLIYQSDRDRATRRVEDPQRPGKIPNELIVRLKPGSKVSIEQLARQLGGKVIGKVDKMNAYRLQFETAEAAEAARKILEARTDDIAKVENNYRWEAPTEMETGSSPPPAAPALKPRLSPDGKNLVVGIIDTATQPLSPEHEAFILSRTDIVPGQPTEEGPWHGTAMAETFLQGLSSTDNAEAGSNVRLRLYNTYGANESATTFDVTRAVFQAAQDGATVLSMSLAGPDRSPMLSDALQSFVQQGGLVFAAAGNDGSNTPLSPASDPWVIAVSGVDSNGQRMPWANYSSTVDVGAPGTSIINYGGMNWIITGTSPATAMAAGMGAGYASRTGSSLSTVRGVIVRDLPFNP